MLSVWQILVEKGRRRHVVDIVVQWQPETVRLRIALIVAALFCGMPAQAQFTLPPQLLDTAAGLLGQWIEATRDDAVRQGVRPVPPKMYRALVGYFPSSLLNGVRYGVGDSDAFSLPGLAFQYGDVAAITLGDVVLFRDQHVAETDVKLWAHELTHVQQFQRWGTAGFAAHYVSDAAGVEREAYANADQFVAWQQRAQR